MIETVRGTIHKYGMLSAKDRILIALSGGADSTALLLALRELSGELDFTLSAIYIDHGIRPEETPQEIEHCRRLCDSIGVGFNVASIDVKGYCNAQGLNLQEGARELRYDCLERRAKELGYTKIALGHTAEDQAETVLMRLIRGTGVSGLSGIPPIRGIIIRPLIEIDRKTLEDFVIDRVKTLSSDLQVPFLIESSNLKTDYLRNRLRLQVIPQLKAINNSLLTVISRFTEIVRDEEHYFNLLVTKTLMRLVSRKGDGFIELFWQPMEGIDRAVLRRVIRRAVDDTTGLRGVSFTHIEQIVELAKKGKSGSRFYINRDTRAVKGYSTLLITSLKPTPLKEQVVNEEGDVILHEAGLVLTVSETDIASLQRGPLDNNTALVDADKASFPFTIRKRQPGDHFYPLGFGKRKKLQDFFVDQKIPREERDSIAIVTKEDKVVWIVGHRMDERFKVDKDTKGVIKFRIKSLRT